MKNYSLEQSPFEHSNIKLERGNRHLAELASVFDDWGKQLTVVVTYDDPEEPVKVRLNKAAPTNFFAGVIGDAVHNYRASLDLLAIALVRINKQSENSVYFPFCESVDSLDYMIKRKNFNRAGAECVELLKTFKPYRTPDWNPLRTIHDLDVMDKHQAIIPAVTTMQNAMIRQASYDDPPMTMACMGGELNKVVQGTKVGNGPWVVFPGWRPPHFSGSLDLVFDSSSSLAGRSVIKTLAEFSREVSRVSTAFFELRVGPCLKHRAVSP